MVEIRYDREADALYMTFHRQAHVVRTDPIDDGTLVDVDADGAAVGIEVIRPSRSWAPHELLARYPVTEDDAATLRQLFGSPTVA